MLQSYHTTHIQVIIYESRWISSITKKQRRNLSTSTIGIDSCNSNRPSWTISLIFGSKKEHVKLTLMMEISEGRHFFVQETELTRASGLGHYNLASISFVSGGEIRNWGTVHQKDRIFRLLSPQRRRFDSQHRVIPEQENENQKWSRRESGFK